MIATIAVIAEKKKFSDHKETTFQRSQQQRSLESGSVHMIAIIAAIVEEKKSSAIAAITTIVAIIWKPGFK